MPDTPAAPALGGVAEIAAMLDVPRTTVSMWDARRRTNGFPDAVERLAMGPVYDLNAVRDWYSSKIARAVDQEGTTP